MQIESLKQSKFIHGLGVCKMSSSEGKNELEVEGISKGQLFDDDGICAEQDGK